jgi:hypothetical protein
LARDPPATLCFRVIESKSRGGRSFDLRNRNTLYPLAFPGSINGASPAALKIGEESPYFLAASSACS